MPVAVSPDLRLHHDVTDFFGREGGGGEDEPEDLPAPDVRGFRE